jgi:hypothetical protein
MKAAKLLEDVQKEVEIALNRVLTAEIGHGKRPEWEEFERNLAFLTEYLRIRHTAKHAAVLEAHVAMPSMFLVRDGEDLWPEQFELDADECNRIAAHTGRTPDDVRACFEAIGGRVR